MTSLYDEFPIRREFLDSVTDKWISEGNDHTLLMNHNLKIQLCLNLEVTGVTGVER